MSHCVGHPDRVAAFNCARCGDYRCFPCERRYEQQVLCPRCFPRVVADTSASYVAIGGSILGFVGLAFPPLAWLGGLLGALDLGRGLLHKRAGGRWLAASAVLFALVSTLVWTVGIVRIIADDLASDAYEGEYEYEGEAYRPTEH